SGTRFLDPFRQHVPQQHRRVADHLFGGRPIDAAVGYRAAVFELAEVGRDGLVAGFDVGFDHHAEQRLVAEADLVDDVGHDQRLQFRLLEAVGMRAVDDDVVRQLGFGQRLFDHGDRDGVVVRAAVAAAQHDVAVGVALGADDGDPALVGQAEEGVRLGGGEDGVDRDAEVAAGAVLEADRGRQAGGHFAVGLRFGGAGADGGPGDEVAVVLRRIRVERLGAGRHADFGDLEQEFAGLGHADVDLEAVVHERVVDVVLPADRGARFFEIDAHDQLQRVADFFGQFLQAVGVVEAGDRVVDGAGADDDDQAVVLAVEDVAQHMATVGDRLGGFLGKRQAGVDFFRRRHFVEGGDVDVFDVVCGHGQWLSWRIMSFTAATLSFRVGQWRRREILSCPANL